MYQPSKIGGADIIDLSVAAEADVAVIAAGQNFNAVDTDLFRAQAAPLVPAPASNRRTQRFVSNEGRGLAAYKAISLANAIPAEDDTVNKPRMLQVFGAGHADSNQALDIQPFLAMLPSNSPLEVKSATNSWDAATNELGRVQLFPLDNYFVSGALREFAFRTTLLPIHSSNTVLLIGITIGNVTNAEQSLRFDLSLSHWRYDSDILSHDPNR